MSGFASTANRWTPIDRQARRDGECRERADRRRPARRSRAAVAANTAFELRMKPWSWAGDRASAAEHLPAVAQQRARRRAVAVAARRAPRRRSWRTGRAAAIAALKSCAAVRQRDPALLHPRRERAPRHRVERREDLVELDRRRDLRLRDRPAVRQLGAVLRARRELDVGLAEQRLLAQDRARVRRAAARTGCRSGSTALVRPVCRSSETETTLPTLTPEIRTSDSWASWTAWLNSALSR